MGSALPSLDLGSGATVEEIRAGTRHTCARLNTGAIKCWGENTFGELGLGDTASRGDKPGEMGDVLPAVNIGPERALSLELGYANVCVVLESFRVKCWGLGQFGLLGNGGTAHL